MAWGGLDFYFGGAVFFCAAGKEKTFPAKVLTPPAFYPAACICTVLDYPWLGHICLRRAWADEKLHKDDGRNRSACGQPACII